MVSRRRQEQHSIMKFAVAFLKMLTLYMLYGELNFMLYFVLIRSWPCRNYKLKFGTRRCPKKLKYWSALAQLQLKLNSIQFELG